jgi:hypothetical protein
MSLKPASSHPRRLPLFYLALFCLLIGGIASLWGYSYVGGNQIEQLPLVMRAIDPSYLANDFFVNTFGPTSPRYFFSELIAILSRLAPLPAVYLALTILCNSLTALVTALFARDLFDSSDAAALFAALAVMSARTFWLGYYNIIYRTPLEPSLLVMPLLLACIWAGLRQRPLLSAAAAGLATLFHPLMGLETGMLMLALVVLEHLLQRARQPGTARQVNLPALLGGGAILAGFAAIVLIPDSRAPTILHQQFIQILAFFRHPHHYVPSTWDFWQYAQAVAFLVPVGFAWRLGYQSSARLKQWTRPLLALCAVLAVLCVGGYVFVELIPVRLWVTAQTFRLLYIVKWLGLVLAGGWIALAFEKAILSPVSQENEPASTDFTGLRLAILLVSLVSQLSLLAAFGYEMLGNRKQTAWVRKPLASLGVLAVEGLLSLAFQPDMQVYFLVGFFEIMALALLYLRPRLTGAALNTAMVCALLVPVFWGSHLRPLPVTPLIDRPVLSLSDVSGEEATLANWARLHTAKNSIFLVNPSLGIFRVTAERAIVVDFIAFPFQDQAMAEWQQRIFDCYGVPKAKGFDAVPQMRDKFTKITDKKLAALRVKYGFDYAVLYKSTKTKYPVIYDTQSYKIIQLNQH